MVQVAVLFHIDEFYFCLVFQNWKRAPKPLLGCQNWVTSTGGCQHLVPGWPSHSLELHSIFKCKLPYAVLYIIYQEIMSPFSRKKRLHLQYCSNRLSCLCLSYLILGNYKKILPPPPPHTLIIELTIHTRLV